MVFPEAKIELDSQIRREYCPAKDARTKQDSPIFGKGKEGKGTVGTNCK